ncbi:serine/threonine protein kinase [bacterium CPR1]|nr:serine/threonine protein kinase [bacterium CPR1]
MAARVVGGRYQLGREIGRGGFGRVHLARDLRDARQLWAVKELTLDLSNPGQAEQVRSFFDQEQKILSWLSHPAIVRRQEAIAEGSTVYLVMEYVDGVTLEEILRRYPDPLPQGMVLSIGEQVAEILAYLHSQKPHPIIFRDLKPSNLMVTPTGKLKLIDFGIARLHNRDSQVRALQLDGHPHGQAQADRLRDRPTPQPGLSGPAYRPPRERSSRTAGCQTFSTRTRTGSWQASRVSNRFWRRTNWTVSPGSDADGSPPVPSTIRFRPEFLA